MGGTYGPERLGGLDPDCGLRHLPPAVARAKQRSMVADASEVRDELLARIVNAIRDDHVAAMESAPSTSILDAMDKWWNH